MPNLRSARGPAALLCAVLLSACGTSRRDFVGAVPTAASILSVARSGAVREAGAAVRSIPQRSWMLPAAGTCNYNGKLPPCGLLYVSDYYHNQVRVFKNSKLVGELAGFNGPDGACSDKHGNVWITNNLGESVVEYAHGGRSPLRTLSDPGVYPLGCAVNPRTGALVVTNIFTTGSGPGSVAIYHKLQGPPLLLSDPDMYYVYFCGFDDASNLYIDGRDAGGGFHFAELPRGKRKFNEIALDGTIYFPGAIAWDGTYVDVGDQLYQDQVASAVYQTTGAGGHIAGTTVLSGAKDVVGYWVGGGSLIGPDANLNSVGLYQYPAGGDPTAEIGDFKTPYGATVSVAR